MSIAPISATNWIAQYLALANNSRAPTANVYQTRGSVMENMIAQIRVMRIRLSVLIGLVRLVNLGINVHYIYYPTLVEFRNIFYIETR